MIIDEHMRMLMEAFQQRQQQIVLQLNMQARAKQERLKKQERYVSGFKGAFAMVIGCVGVP